MSPTTTKRRSSATARKATGRKQATGKAATAKAAKSNGRVSTIDPRDLQVQAKVAELRAKGKSWTEVCEAFKVSTGNKGRLELAYFYSLVKPKDRIKGDDDEVASAIVEAREDNQPWGLIAARCGMPEGKVRKLFESASGKSAKGLNVASKRKAARGDEPAAKKTGKAKPAAKRAGRRSGRANPQ